MSDKAQYTEPTQTIDLQARKEAEAGTAEAPEDLAKSWAGDGNDQSAFVGVNPEYQNYADITGKPMFAEGDGAQAQLEAYAVLEQDKANDPDAAELQAGQPVGDEDEDDKEPETPATPGTDKTVTPPPAAPAV